MKAVLDRRVSPALSAALEKRGFSTVTLPPHPDLPAPVASHPDLLIFPHGNSIYTTARYADVAARELALIERDCGMKTVTVPEELGSPYPRDILFDALPMGRDLFCLEEHTSAAVKALYRVIRVRQGYAKCATLPITPRALITSDPSVSEAAERAGIEVLNVRQGSVLLPGYDTGFLGGAASFDPEWQLREIFFSGDLRTHPDAGAIEAFCREHGRIPVSLLPGEPLTDIGTAFFLRERKSK